MALSHLEESIQRVRDHIALSASKSGRDPSEVKLVAVSKGVSIDKILASVSYGLYDFGENRAAEAEAKSMQLGVPVSWHFIGRLQANKAARVARFARFIHSIDRVEIATRIDQKAPTLIEAMIEVNISGEQGKSGVSLEEAEGLVQATQHLAMVRVIGLMTMAPESDDPELARPYFRRLADLGERLRSRFPAIQHLSMGMSQDYEVAVEEGSTMVRVGRAIFGRQEE